MRSAAAIVLTIALSGLTSAQDSLKTMPNVPPVDFGPGIFSTIAKLVMSLVVVVGLIYLCVFLLKKISNKTLPNSEQLIKVVSRSYLTPKQSLYIVKLGLKYAVLGVGENSVNLIKELSPEEVETLKQPEIDRQKNFQSVLKSILKK